MVRFLLFVVGIHINDRKELRYAIPDLELVVITVVYAIEHVYTYLCKKFQVVTDHKALKWFKNIKGSRSKRLVQQ